MHSPTRRYVTALAISGALLVAGCSGSGDNDAGDTGSDKELFLQPVAAAGPDPFTDSTAKVTETPPPVTRTPQPSPTGSASPTQAGIRSIQGSTPGLYGGTHSVSSCDVEQQVRFLTTEQSKARAFAQVAGIQQNEIAGWLRGLTPVQLRVDTRITNHGYSGGQATSFQSVLQAGTAVLVDNRGMPRVRCACGNPLTPPAELHREATHHGQPWQGYHPTNVVVVKPSTTVINNITIINVTNNTWIERPIGDDGDKDKIVPPPTPTPDPSVTDPDGESPDPPTDDPTSEDPDGPASEDPTTDDPTSDDPTSTDPADDPTDTDPTDTDESTDPTDGSDTETPSPTDCPTLSPTPTAPGAPTPTIPAGCPVPLPVPVPDTDPQVPDGGDATVPDGGQDPFQEPTDRTDIPSLPQDETVPDVPGDETGPESVPEVPDVEPGPDTPFIPDPTGPEEFSG
ncbi:DUF6777 domain-containing protein [Streptomyces indicus]|uniref:DUF6777 domain-containing protein n=1 Tax=Streptomyces indicus TaxID=417292 RepID=A0A1G8TZQ4_9ACTN|nr:DUF6777 domain-containing protein [Streptomyces indicus]SDJ46937.1 hypothetical protein SAMN05421806_101547 [Streptomyces indicus]